MNIASYSYILKMYEIAYRSKGKKGLEFRKVEDWFTILHFTYSIETTFQQLRLVFLPLIALPLETFLKCPQKRKLSMRQVISL